MMAYVKILRQKIRIWSRSAKYKKLICLALAVTFVFVAVIAYVSQPKTLALVCASPLQIGHQITLKDVKISRAHSQDHLDSSQIHQLIGAYLTSPCDEGEEISLRKVTLSAKAKGFPETIEKGKRAFLLFLEKGSHVRMGNHIDLFCTPSSQGQTQLLLQNIKVLDKRRKGEESAELLVSLNLYDIEFLSEALTRCRPFATLRNPEDPVLSKATSRKKRKKEPASFPIFVEGS